MSATLEATPIAAPDPDRTAATLNMWAWVLVGLSIVVPIGALIATHANQATAGAIGEAIGRLILPFGIAWVCTRKSTETTKARARLGAASVVLLLALFGTYSTIQRQQAMKGALGDFKEALNLYTEADPSKALAAKPQATAALPETQPESGSTAAFVKGMSAIAKRSAISTQQLRQQMGAIDLGTVLASDTLTQPAKLAQARATVESFRKLVVAMDAEMKSYWSAMETYLQTAPASYVDRRNVTKGYEDSVVKARALFFDWRDTELQVVGLVNQMLDFAAERQGHLRLERNQLVIDNDADLARYQDLIKQIRAAAAHEDTVTARYEQQQAHQKEQMAGFEKQLN